MQAHFSRGCHFGRPGLRLIQIPAGRPPVSHASLFDSFFNQNSKTSKVDVQAERKRLINELTSLVAISRLNSAQDSRPQRETTREAIARLADDLNSSFKDTRVSSEGGAWAIEYSSVPMIYPLSEGPSGPLTLGESSPLPVEKFEQVGDGVLLYTISTEVKSLGFISGSFERKGVVSWTGSHSYEIDLNETVYKNGLGSTVIKRIRDLIKVNLLYQDEEIKVASITTEEGEGEAALIISKKTKREISEGRARRPSLSATPSSNIIPGIDSLFGKKKKTLSGFATRSERLALRKIEQDSQKKGQRKQAPSSPPPLSEEEIQKRQEDVKARARVKENERRENQARIVRNLREADEKKAMLDKEAQLSKPSPAELADAKSLLEAMSDILRKAMGTNNEP